MPVRSIQAFHTSIRLKKPIRHASFSRRNNDTLLIRCELEDGSVGWGEGLPRHYVTGETIDSCWRHLQALDIESIRPISNPNDVVTWTKHSQLPQISPPKDASIRPCFGNSVRCAIELALLDATCRSADISMSDLIARLASERQIAQTSAEVFYSGAIMSEGLIGQIRSALKMKLFGFRHVKVKVGAQGISDVSYLKRIRRILGKAVDIRLDANEAWQPHDIPQKIASLMPSRPSCLEQPVPHASVHQLAEVRQEIDVPIMLDESLCCEQDAQDAISNNLCDGFNIRLSKCGGLVASLNLVAQARAAGLFCQLGCLVGETGILSAAGRHFATQVSGLHYLEGSFDRFLVLDPLTKQDITFGYSGRGKMIRGTGLGITIDEAAVEARTIRKMRL